MKLLLCNWTHRHNIPGGTENRYAYLKQIFPDAELISSEDLFGDLHITDVFEAAKKMDEYYLKRYQEDKDILIIRDGSVGGILDISKIPQITYFGNHYASLREIFGENKCWNDLLKLQKGAEKTTKVAISNFIKEEMKKNNLNDAVVIENPVDLDFFQPTTREKTDLKKAYNIPFTQKVGIWVGTPEFKNFGIIERIIASHPEIFWIIVFKDRGNARYRNVRVFNNVKREIIQELYNCADFFVLTPPYDGGNHSVLEAMATNLPCVVSQSGLFWDFWDARIGFRVKYNDYDGHVSAILKIIESPKGTFSSRQVLIDRKLDLNSYKEKWLNLFKKFEDETKNKP